MPRHFQRILASLATLLVAAHAHAFEAGWMQIQTAGATPVAPTTTVALYYPTMAAPRVVAMGPFSVDAAIGGLRGSGSIIVRGGLAFFVRVGLAFVRGGLVFAGAVLVFGLTRAVLRTRGAYSAKNGAACGVPMWHSLNVLSCKELR